jgi:hypothetical protein
MTEPLVDECILEEGNEAAEIANCKNYLDPHERLLAIIAGDVDGRVELNRLALTDRRVILYSQVRLQRAISFGYEEIVTVKGKKGMFLTHLGEINLLGKSGSVRFKNMGEQYLEQITKMISRMRRESTT